MNRLLAPLALAAVLLMATVIVCSAYLRHAGAGAPMPAGTAVTEGTRVAARLAHRIAATGALAVAVALVVLGWRARRVAGGTARWSAALLVLALGLAVLGVFTPASRVPAVPMANLLGGFLMLAVAARLTRPATSAALGAPAFAVAVLLVVHAGSGVLASTLHAGSVCADARECLRVAARTGWNWAALDPWRAVDASGAAPAAAALAQVLHRGLLWLTLPAVAALGLLAVLRVRWLEGGALVVLLFAQMALGAAVIAGAPAPAMVLWHNAVAAAMLALALRLA